MAKFGGFGGGNMQQLMRQAQKMQQEMMELCLLYLCFLILRYFLELVTLTISSSNKFFTLSTSVTLEMSIVKACDMTIDLDGDAVIRRLRSRAKTCHKLRRACSKHFEYVLISELFVGIR